MAKKISNFSEENLIPFDEPVSREFLKKKVEAELNETQEIGTESLEQLKALIKEHNVRSITTDDFLLRFLKTRKFKVQSSFEAVRIYAKERAAVHHLISNLQPEILESCLRNKIFGVLPYRDYEGRLIIYIKEGNWKDSICTDEEIAIYGFILICYLVDDENTQINGIHVLLEESSFSLRNALIGIHHLYVRRNFLFKSAPMRYHRVDIINEPSQVKYLFQIVKPFLPQKIKNRVFFHGKHRDELFQHIPQCLLETVSESSMDDPFLNQKSIGFLKEYLEKVKEEQRYFISEQSEQ